jgi:cytochrome c biogenesis protein ResB
MKHTIKVLTLLIVIGLAGCATNKDLEEVKALAQQANTTAEEALKTARSAENTALEANTMSNSTANDLERMAQDKKKMRK